MIYALLLPEWLKQEQPDLRPLHGEFTDEEIKTLNNTGYNVYFYPNYPKLCANPSEWLDGKDIDTFEYVYVDMDLKDGTYATKDAFVSLLCEAGLPPTRIVDSGGGVHVYWKVTDLEAMSFLKLNRRLARAYKTDLAVGKIKQLMRLPNTLNTKVKDAPKPCEVLFEDLSIEYTTEQLSNILPQLTLEDENYCKAHFDKTYEIEGEKVEISDKLPFKFGQLLQSSKEVNDIWSGKGEDRSTADFRLGHLMLAAGFSKEEAASVLVNSAKALERGPKHRVTYAMNIIDKIWTFEEKKEQKFLSSSVRDILARTGDALKGERFECWDYIDKTEHGFRLGQVIGLVAGSGVGKTAVALNIFQGFVEKNPAYDHLFVCLEQPDREIADRWKTMCGDNTGLYDRVQVMANYDEDGKYRRVSLDEIKEYILEYNKRSPKRIGSVVIDHIGALKKKGSKGENQDLMDICHSMKAFAIETNALLMMQSQTNREKAGNGDLELNKDAAMGTTYFESYCDYLITIWQPLKLCYREVGCPTVTAFKFCKIRHKKQGVDTIQEDVPYSLFFDPNTEHLRKLTTTEEKSLVFFNNKAVNKRKQDRKTDIITYTSVNWTKEESNGTANNG